MREHGEWFTALALRATYSAVKPIRVSGWRYRVPSPVLTSRQADPNHLDRV